MQNWRFDNRLIQELPQDPLTENLSRPVFDAIWSAVLPTQVKQPKLLAWSAEMAETLDLKPEDVLSPEFAEVFAGNRLWPGMHSYATRYGGHQFGHWAGQLGDGRAIYLGEIVNQAGQRWELQLKGAGPTPYSRRADGRAVLRSSLREFLCSEAMHHLGIPTTRALCLVGTGEGVWRDILYQGNPEIEPGAIVCRVAPSFLRFGHYEILSASDEPELLKKLVDFTLARDFPEIEGDPASKRLQWFAEVCRRTAILLAHWMRVGFVHGVMNTDNMSILGLTIDYGPYGWIEPFDPGWTPNTTDAQGRRYRFGNQPQIALWNLMRLAEALGGLFESLEPLEAALVSYGEIFGQTQQGFTIAKFGFEAFEERESELTQRVFGLMQRSEVDMTLFFRALALIDPHQPQLASLQEAFYEPERLDREAWHHWLRDYAAQLPTDPAQLAARRQRMNQVNPCYVLRNYLAQEAIDLAQTGDLSRIRELQQALRQPYTLQPEFEHLRGKRPEWARQRPGCSMLSCSS